MTSFMPDRKDTSRACWRCRFWGGVYEGTSHGLCERPKAIPVAATPATGCAFWQLGGPGADQPADWRPAGLEQTPDFDPMAPHRQAEQELWKRAPAPVSPEHQAMLDHLEAERRARIAAEAVVALLRARSRRR
jgi:hypothetical protein